MSAIAVVADYKRMLLLSDGLAVNVAGMSPSPDMVMPDSRIVSRNHSKLIKVNDQIGVLWMGSLSGKQRFIDCTDKPDTPKEVAYKIAECVKEDISDEPSLLHTPWWNVNITVLGYVKGEGWGYHVTKKNGRITAGNEYRLPDIFINAKAALSSSADARADFLKHLKTPTPQFTTVREKAEHAFAQLVSTYAEENRAGGQIFSEMLVNPACESTNEEISKTELHRQPKT